MYAIVLGNTLISAKKLLTDVEAMQVVELEHDFAMKTICALPSKFELSTVPIDAFADNGKQILHILKSRLLQQGKTSVK